jgi:hypothetical protein
MEILGGKAASRKVWLGRHPVESQRHVAEDREHLLPAWAAGQRKGIERGPRLGEDTASARQEGRGRELGGAQAVDDAARALVEQDLVSRPVVIQNETDVVAEPEGRAGLFGEGPEVAEVGTDTGPGRCQDSTELIAHTRHPPQSLQAILRGVTFRRLDPRVPQVLVEDSFAFDCRVGTQNIPACKPIPAHHQMYELLIAARVKGGGAVAGWIAELLSHLVEARTEEVLLQ